MAVLIEYLELLLQPSTAHALMGPLYYMYKLKKCVHMFMLDLVKSNILKIVPCIHLVKY